MSSFLRRLAQVGMSLALIRRSIATYKSQSPLRYLGSSSLDNRSRVIRTIRFCGCRCEDGTDGSDTSLDCIDTGRSNLVVLKLLFEALGKRQDEAIDFHQGVDTLF